VGAPASAPQTPSLPWTGPSVDPAFFFIASSDASGWKALPVPGAYIKLLSADRDRGYAVVLGRLDAGVRYPAHPHETAEDFLLLSGDLTIAGRRLGSGDFHHCAAGTEHPVNYSDQGCTLIAVLSIEHDLVKFAMA
jgi:anti-sigma factor ChrR (cupin superfamily)